MTTKFAGSSRRSLSTSPTQAGSGLVGPLQCTGPAAVLEPYSQVCGQVNGPSPARTPSQGPAKASRLDQSVGIDAPYQRPAPARLLCATRRPRSGRFTVIRASSEIGHIAAGGGAPGIARGWPPASRRCRGDPDRRVPIGGPWTMRVAAARAPGCARRCHAELLVEPAYDGLCQQAYLRGPCRGVGARPSRTRRRMPRDGSAGPLRGRRSDPSGRRRRGPRPRWSTHARRRAGPSRRRASAGRGRRDTPRRPVGRHRDVADVPLLLLVASIESCPCRVGSPASGRCSWPGPVRSVIVRGRRHRAGLRQGQSAPRQSARVTPPSYTA